MRDNTCLITRSFPQNLWLPEPVFPRSGAWGCDLSQPFRAVWCILMVGDSQPVCTKVTPEGWQKLWRKAARHAAQNSACDATSGVCAACPGPDVPNITDWGRGAEPCGLGLSPLECTDM